MELASAASYLQMAAYFSHQNLDGMSRWMRAQAEEERSHADRFLDFILDRGGKAVIGEVEAPRGEFSGAEEVFATALSQEEAVTAAIHDLYRLADKLGDLASIPFLLDFISEQTEEEAMVSAIVVGSPSPTGNQGRCSSWITSWGPGTATPESEPGPVGPGSTCRAPSSPDPERHGMPGPSGPAGGAGRP